MITFPKISKNGFTLIELLVVATIIIVLTTIGLVSYRTVARNSRDAKRKSDLETVRQAAIMYRSETGEYPVCGGSTPNTYFNGCVTTLFDAGYLTESAFTDPVNDYPQNYRYSSSGGIKRIYTTLESNNTEYSLTWP